MTLFLAHGILKTPSRYPSSVSTSWYSVKYPRDATKAMNSCASGGGETNAAADDASASARTNPNPITVTAMTANTEAV